MGLTKPALAMRESFLVGERVEGRKAIITAAGREHLLSCRVVDIESCGLINISKTGGFYER